MLVLDGAQAGLSWYTILKKREAYRRAFDGFDPERIARYGEKKVASLLQDTGIVRNRLKVRSAIGNARAWLDLRESGVGFSDFLWEFTGGVTIVNAWRRLEDVPAATPASEAMSKALKRRGFRFVGPTICYAFMQGRGDGERPSHLVLPLEGVHRDREPIRGSLNGSPCLVEQRTPPNRACMGAFGSRAILAAAARG